VEPRAGIEPATYSLQEINWSEYKAYLMKKYCNQYGHAQYNIAVKYQSYLDNPLKILSLSTSIRGNVLKGLIALSRYLGRYEDFSKDLKRYGVKWITQDSFKSFLSIVNNNHSDLIQWFKDCERVFPDNEKVFLKFLLVSGLRKTECERSFNRLIALHKDNKVSEYYNSETKVLEHFRYPDNLRHTKNCYISVVSEELLSQICTSKSVSYTMVRRHLQSNRLGLRLRELRSLNNSFMRKHGLLSEAIDILSGRVPKSVFVQHYLKLSLSELSSQVLPLQVEMLKSVEA